MGKSQKGKWYRHIQRWLFSHKVEIFNIFQNSRLTQDLQPTEISGLFRSNNIFLT